MSAPVNGRRSAYPSAVAELLPAARILADELGELPSQNRLRTELKIGRPKAGEVRDVLAVERGAGQGAGEAALPDAPETASDAPADAPPDAPTVPVPTASETASGAAVAAGVFAQPAVRADAPERGASGARPVRRWASRLAAGTVAGIAAIASYSHMRGLALHYGQEPLIATLLPLSVDGLVVCAAVAIGDGRRHTWSAWLSFWVGVGASVVANVLAARPDPVARSISAWPAVALLLVVEVLSRSGRKAARDGQA